MSVAVLMLAVQAFADSPAPLPDFKQVTENKQYVFVMIAPGEWVRPDPGIRRVYKQSGLYRNDGSTTPLWVVDWYAFDVIPSSDGHHLIRLEPRGASMNELAVSFHRDGIEIKKYLIRDLIRDESRLAHTASRIVWMSEVKYDDERGILFLKTRDDQTYRFPVQTGQMQP
jgi:hypothetical protein